MITRAAEQSRSLARELTRQGRKVLSFPVVEFRAPRDWRPLEQAVARLRAYDWVIFTSQNAVRFFFEAVRRVKEQQGFDGSPRPLVAAVGRATRRALARRRVEADLCPESFSAVALFESLRPRVAGKKILLPQSDRALPELARRMREAGAEVESVVAYQTVPPAVPDGRLRHRIRSGQVDAVVFASPSAVENFVEIIGPHRLAKVRARICWASIGPTTSAALRRFGLTPVEAAEATSAGLAQALAEHFSLEAQPLVAG